MEQRQQHLLGYFAVVLLGLLGANALSDWLVVLIEPSIPQLAAHHGILTSALFFAVCFANPYVWVIGQTGLRMTLVWAGAGFVFGFIFHLVVIEPFVGMAFARFAMLMTAALAVPLHPLRSWVSAEIERRRPAPPPEPEHEYSDLDIYLTADE